MGRKHKDLTGRKFGSFIVIGRDPNSKTRKWLCKCECGNPLQFSFEPRYLMNGGHPHCGCLSKQSKLAISKEELRSMYVIRKLSIAEIVKLTNLHRNTISKYVAMYNLKSERELYVMPLVKKETKRRGPKPKALINKRFGMLTVIDYTDKLSGDKPIVRCKCDCGNEIEVPSNNLYGLNTTSCGCTKSSIREKIIREFLLSKGTEFKEQYILEGCRYKYELRFDFAIFNGGRLTCLIEFDGEQHYKPIEYFGGEEAYKMIQKRDRIKDKYCRNNRIKLVRIPYTKRDNIKDVMSILMNSFTSS